MVARSALSLFPHCKPTTAQHKLKPLPLRRPTIPLRSLLGLLLAPLCIERFGWPSVFYLFGGMGLLWCLWWEKLVAEVK